MVAISLKVMPDSPDVDMNRLKADIAKSIEIKDAKLEPLAFGLKSLKLLVVAKDVGTEEIEAKIKAIPGVADVIVESATLL
ncbi:MAG: elongation factor 1-beta [Candidatus Aenigmatarchaeota archaeon]